MKQEMKMVALQHNQNDKCDLTFLSADTVKKVRAFHKSFPMYRETPLAQLPETAKEMGLDKIYVKDESYRFGLNAFKVLGGSFAIGNYLARKLNKSIDEVSFFDASGSGSKEAIRRFDICNGD